jgi:hypothetical protein
VLTESNHTLVTENKVEEQTMHAAIKHLQALPAHFDG